ncbi:MAG TPA: DUF1302 family protein [Candidatus Binatia bacterium]|jgi:hypothetical protein
MKRLSTFLKVAVCLAILAPTPAHAIYRDANVDFGGSLRTTNIFRTPDIDKWYFIMQRNTLKLRLEYKWLQRGKAFNSWNMPFIERSDLFVLYRGVYDSVYDYTPGMSDRKDISGDPIPAQFASLDSIPKHTRDELKFNNLIREAYADVYFKSIPLTMRIGKQQVVWGESDGFRMLDRANTLDLSWHFFQELPPPGYGFDELRQPFFMVKGLWDLKQVGPLSQTFLEAYWNPGFDWNPGKIAFLPRPWGARLLDPLSNAEGTGVFQSSFCINASDSTCDSLLNGTKLFNQGNYKKNPAENSQFGVRFHFLAGSTEWTVNYLYQRFAPDGSPTAIVRGIPEDKNVFVPELGTSISSTDFCNGVSFNGNDPNIAAQIPWAKNQFCAEYFAPYIHTVGLSFNWFEGEWTQTVWRVETIVDFDLPFYDGDKQNALFGRAPNGPILLPGITKRNMWKGMLAFDRPTWIRWLNKKTTFFLSGQLFWHYIIDMKSRRCAINDIPEYCFAGGAGCSGVADGAKNPNFIGYTASPTENCGDDNNFLLPGEQTGFIGPLDLPKLDAPAGKGRDTIHQWEVLMTFAALGFYRGGTLVPALIYLMDPVNSYSQELALGFDWFYTPDLALNLTTRLIWVGAPWNPYDGHKNANDVDNGQIFDPWFLGGGSRGRSETSVQFTWQF